MNTFQISTISALVAALLSGGSAFLVTRDHYQGVIAESEAKRLTLQNTTQMRVNAAFAFATTTSNLLVTQTSTKYERTLADAKAQFDRDIGAVRAGALRLRDNAATCSSRPATPESGSGAVVPADTGGAELSVPATEFLLGEAERANGIVRKLNACAEVVKADRAVIEQLTKQLQTTK